MELSKFLKPQVYQKGVNYIMFHLFCLGIQRDFY
jgi:hypothetical protein